MPDMQTTMCLIYVNSADAIVIEVVLTSGGYQRLGPLQLKPKVSLSHNSQHYYDRVTQYLENT